MCKTIRHSLFLCALLIFALMPAISVQAAGIDLDHVSLATGVDIGEQDGVFDNFTIPNEGSINNNGWTSFRTGFEFDVAGLPAGSVESALLTMTIANWEGQRSLEVHGYAGNGVVELSDLALDHLLASTAITPVFTDLVFDVTSFITDLRASDVAYAGFNLREEPANTANYVVMGLVGNPVLSVEYSEPIPEPSTFALMGLGVIGVALARFLRKSL